MAQKLMEVFVLNKNVFDYIKDDSSIWEEDPLINLTKDGELMAYDHRGFWQPMDTLRDKIYSLTCGSLITLHGKFGKNE